jgi:hypothetical protein
MLALADWRAGRDASYRLVALTIGAGIAVADALGSSLSRRSGMRGCQPPGTGRCITAPGKVSGSRRFYVIIRGTAWSGGAVATATADAPHLPFAVFVGIGSVGWISAVPDLRGL